MTVMSANHSTMAEWNRKSIIQLLREHESLSRLQLSQMTNLRGSTVTRIVREFMETGLLTTVGKRTASRAGPKEILVKINPDYGYSVGVELSPDYLQIAILDAACKVITQETVDRAYDLSRVASAVKSVVDEQVKIRKIPGKLLGIGIGVPGIVNTQSGVILNSIIYKVKNFNIAQEFSDVFADQAVVVDHNVNFAALAEMRLGSAAGLQNFIHFFIGHRPTRSRPTFRAFGTSLVIRGEVLRGNSFAAGEIDEYLRPKTDFQPTAQELACLQSTEQTLTPQLQSLALSIGKPLASLVNLLDPQAVIISSNQAINNRLFIALLRDETMRLLMPIQNRELNIQMSILGQQAMSIGAALAVADAALSS